MTNEQLRQYFPTAGEIHKGDNPNICLWKSWTGRSPHHTVIWMTPNFVAQGHIAICDLHEPDEPITRIKGRFCNTELAAIKSLAREVRKFGNRIVALAPEVK